MLGWREKTTGFIPIAGAFGSAKCTSISAAQSWPSVFGRALKVANRG